VDGKILIKDHVEGSPEAAEELGTNLAEILLSKGAREILDEIYRRSGPTISI